MHLGLVAGLGKAGFLNGGHVGSRGLRAARSGLGKKPRQIRILSDKKKATLQRLRPLLLLGGRLMYDVVGNCLVLFFLYGRLNSPLWRRERVVRCEPFYLVELAVFLRSGGRALLTLVLRCRYI